MKMYCIEMEDMGKCSYERYYLVAESEEKAKEYLFKEHPELADRPNSVTTYEKGESAIEIY